MAFVHSRYSFSPRGGPRVRGDGGWSADPDSPVDPRRELIGRQSRLATVLPTGSERPTVPMRSSGVDCRPAIAPGCAPRSNTRKPARSPPRRARCSRRRGGRVRGVAHSILGGFCHNYFLSSMIYGYDMQFSTTVSSQRMKLVPELVRPGLESIGTTVSIRSRLSRRAGRTEQYASLRVPRNG